MIPVAAVDRARSAIGAPVSFRLGSGPRHVDQAVPADDKGNCDCSAFVCWALGLPKVQRGLSLNVNTFWTSAIRRQIGLESIVTPELGALILYPAVASVREIAPSMYLGDAKKDWLDGRRTGHIGIISEIDEGKVRKVVHLHPLNFKDAGAVIAETGPELFDHPATIYARCEALKAIPW